ncbi:transmembrane protein 51b [Cynoglossus semilaevis]|uniref:Transmembrane protein 51b n=1 Tax=Cynoglossus semilaevis TaxID=244447 RepID=A0A3P8X418_CYNSE|nr:transmembrane protein 51 [Cynoglossus semilaevis]XP_024916224.1 transmembrane protein 51 [Cynoglossus semilaevis]
MCSSRGICRGNGNQSNRSSSGENVSSGAHYALCALGVGLIALGVVMIVWTVIPMDGEATAGSKPQPGNSTTGSEDGGGDEEESDHTKSSSVAMVLIGVGAAMLLLSICLGVRSKRMARNRRSQAVATSVPFTDQVSRDPEETSDSNAYNVPSYEEVVGSDTYPVRDSNLRHSTSQLPSYEDIIAAVENEGSEPMSNATEDTPLNQTAPAPAQPPDQTQSDRPGLAPKASLPTRSSSRASRLLRPLRVRRIKSDKLHLKDFRLQIRSPTQNPVNIEPITPPPQYDTKMPELQ